MKHITSYIEDDLYNELKAIADTKKWTICQLIREIVKEYQEKNNDNK